jgi:hypothetical protein
MDDPAVAQLEDGDLVDPVEATPSRGMAEPGARVGGGAGEPADDLVALGDQRSPCGRRGKLARNGAIQPLVAGTSSSANHRIDSICRSSISC